MKKLFLVGMVAWLFLTGCTFNIGDFDTIDSNYRFANYEEYLDIKDTIDSDYFTVERVEKVALDDVHSLTLATIFEDVNVYYEDRDDVVIRYFGIFSDKTNNKEPEYEIDMSGRVVFEVSWKKLVGSNHALMEVVLPESFKNDISIKTVSADIAGDSLVAEDVYLKTVSGDVDFKKIESDNLDASSVSGDIDVFEFMGKDINIDTTSGEIRVTASQSEGYSISSVSGDVDLTLDAQTDDIYIDTVSGKVNLTIKDADASLDFKSTSGDIRTDLQLKDVSINKDNQLRAEVGKGQHTIRIKTVSGDIDLR